MKQEFEKPEVDVIQFDKKDVIATSPAVVNQAIGGNNEPVGGDCAIDED